MRGGTAAAATAASLLLLAGAAAAASQGRDGDAGREAAQAAGRGRAGGERAGGERPGGPDGRRPPGGGDGGWRRGQVLPPAARDAYVPDPGRYHLRAAPPGYGWVGDGRDAYLTQRSTGLVLDRVPGAYEPAPAWRRSGREERPR